MNDGQGWTAPRTVLVYRFEEQLSEPVMTKSADITLITPNFPRLEIALERVFRK